jgi:hypothetical protein
MSDGMFETLVMRQPFVQRGRIYFDYCERRDMKQDVQVIAKGKSNEAISQHYRTHITQDDIWTYDQVKRKA